LCNISLCQHKNRIEFGLCLSGVRFWYHYQVRIQSREAIGRLNHWKDRDSIFPCQVHSVKTCPNVSSILRLGQIIFTCCKTCAGGPEQGYFPLHLHSVKTCPNVSSIFTFGQIIFNLLQDAAPSTTGIVVRDIYIGVRGLNSFQSAYSCSESLQDVLRYPTLP
jgi:hypothetical protein